MVEAQAHIETRFAELSIDDKQAVEESVRKCGTRVITFEKTDIESMKTYIPRIREEVKKHGMIILRGIDYESPELIELAEEFGKPYNGELVHLPKFLSFDNIDPRYP